MTKAYSLVIASYLLALAAAIVTFQFVAGYHPLVQILIADIVATIVVFAFSLAFNNSSFYDPYWSVIPIVIALYLMTLTRDSDLTRQVLILALVTFWGVRLTLNWLYTWGGLDHVDWRYINLKEISGVLWWPLSFIGVHMMPTLIVFLGCIPMYGALVVGKLPLNFIDGVALAVGLVSIWLEFQSDRELHRFRETRQSKAEVLETGLWGWCRHPNYLGEIGVWVSIFLFGYAGLGYVDMWMASGPIAMILLFTVVSIPMIEKKLEADKPGYSAYKAKISTLIPLSVFR